MSESIPQISKDDVTGDVKETTTIICCGTYGKHGLVRMPLEFGIHNRRCHMHAQIKKPNLWVSKNTPCKSAKLQSTNRLHLFVADYINCDNRPYHIFYRRQS